MNKPIIVITGPTASGKTSLAIDLANKFDGEIINADSRSIYREMDIATSKPTRKELDNIAHHLVDIVDPNESFSLSDYKKLAEKEIKSVQDRGKIPLLVGGTGLYIDAVVYDFNLTEIAPDQKYREELEKLSTTEIGIKLKEVDPETYKIIDRLNRRRLIRALEVATQSQKSLTKLQTKKPLPRNVLYFVLDCPREVLYKKIDNRVDAWFSKGLVEETKNLSAKYSFDLPSMSSIGYHEIAQYLDGRISLSEASEIMKKRTRNYAKRQITWFKRNQDAVWIGSEKEALSLITSFLK
jgi:tRNA dimethylallyltransferase